MFDKLKKIFRRQKADQFATDITRDDANIITNDKINFILDQAVGYMKEIENSNKVIFNRATLLLTYLITISSWMTNSIATNIYSSFTSLNDTLFIWYTSTLLCYIFLMFLLVVFCLIPKLKNTVNNEPRNLFIKDTMIFDLKMIKFSEIENLQTRIDENYMKNKRSAKILFLCIISTIVVPAISFLFLLFSL